MKQTTKRAIKRFRGAVIGLLVGLFWLIGGPKAFAQTYIELFPSISSTGVVIGSGCPWGTGDIYGVQNYKGVYNTGTLFSYSNMDSVCGAYVGGYGWDMEGGYATNTTTTDGNYYTFITHSGSAYTPNWSTGTTYYWRATRTAGVWAGVMSDIIVSTPIPSGEYLSPVSFSGSFNNNTGYNYILVYIANQTEGGQSYTKTIPIDSTAESGDYSAEYDLPVGDYYIMYRYYNSINYTFSTWYPEENSTFYPITVIPFVSDEIVYEVCETTDVACYLRNGMHWAFVVPLGTFDKFTQLKETLSTKAPFGYITSLFETLGGLNNAESATFELESVSPINDLIFTPIRTALIWILYFAFAFMLFKRFRDIQI